MPNTPVSPSGAAGRALIHATLRSHRLAIAVWAVGGSLVMFAMSLAIAREMADFPGGPQALAATVLPGAEAMRPLRWPAERLDTLGGYLTYHNLTIFTFFLSLYAAIQGTRAIRASEERAVMEEILATGVSRIAVVRDSAVAFVFVLALTCTAVALGVAVAMWAGGEPNVAGSVVTMAATGLCAMVAYGIGLLVSQFTRTARQAAGVSSLLLVGLYLASTTLDPPGGLGVVAWLSPFWWANSSRALVPGHGLDAAAFAVMIAMAVVLVGLAALAFDRRDYQAPLWRMPVRDRAQRTWHPHLTTRLRFGSLWTATLLRSRMGLMWWILAAAGFSALMVSLAPKVIGLWENFSFLTAVFAGRGVTLEDQYMSYSAELAGPVVAAYVVVQASGWVADGTQGRLDMVLSTPRSSARVVAERVAAAGAGVLLIALGAMAGLALAAAAVGVPMNWAGAARTLVVTVLFGMAIAGVAAALTVLVPSSLSVMTLAVLLTAMYLLDYLVPMLDWPTWLHRLSLFWAYGHPYLGWPTSAQLAVALVAVAGGTAVACGLSAPRRHPRKASGTGHRGMGRWATS